MANRESPECCGCGGTGGRVFGGSDVEGGRDMGGRGGC